MKWLMICPKIVYNLQKIFANLTKMVIFIQLFLIFLNIHEIFKQTLRIFGAPNQINGIPPNISTKPDGKFFEVNGMKEQIDRVALGRFIRQQRKKRKLRQTDLTDEKLTQPVLSSIENGRGQVSVEKLEYVLKKLGVKEDVTCFSMQKTKEEKINETIRLQLTAVETIIDLISPDPGLARLRELNIHDDHPLSVWAHYLKGKAYAGKKKGKKAQKHFTEAILRLEQQYPEMAESNLHSASYNGLSLLEYMTDQYGTALRYAKQARECFQEEGERRYLKEIILVNQAIYLEKLNRLEEAQNTLNELKKEQAGYLSKEALLYHYDVRSSILAKARMHSMAIQSALKGIELARVDKMADRLMKFWGMLGRIYIESGQLHQAEICLETAQQLEKKVRKAGLSAYLYIQLATWHEKKKQAEPARNYSLKALASSRKAGLAYHECEALMLMANSFFLQNENHKAFQTLKEALQIATQHSFSDLTDRIHLLIGAHLGQLGERHTHAFALDFLHSHVKSREKKEPLPVTLPADSP
jgi:transcriptional regulator with XRE-family HTH domain